MDNQPQKRGRPRKNSDAVTVSESPPRKRGRPKKAAEESVADSVQQGVKKIIPPGEKRLAAGKSRPFAEKLRAQTENDIFALDIGTRTVVGIIGHMEDGVFRVVDSVTVAHSQRAMTDGQIEDIDEVARIAGIVKAELEHKRGIKLENVAVAAAGRTLKTKRVEIEFDIADKGAVTADDVKSFEVDAVSRAQTELDADDSLVFYCVGHTVVSYSLDDYKIKTLAGHKGKKAKVEIIAAFLPSVVVESLYSVMDLCSLEVTNMTLEPIAAMNVIIPPEVRLINIALVDIGAGTSDIAISKNGSIVAYAMSTLAGDEVTEEIIKTYLVDFQTAEEMKMCGKTAMFEYTDILGNTTEIKTEDFFKSLSPVLNGLADNIAENIIKANGGASPAAVFLVGGGSLIPGIAGVLAQKLGIAENRVAIGGKSALRHIDFGDTGTSSPEYVTPVGIGLTSVISRGYDFSMVTLNGKKTRVFNSRTITLIDLLAAAGYKTTQIIGRSGRGLTFTLNGEKQVIKGELAIPAVIKLNGGDASINMTVRQGDTVEFIPAVSGENAVVKISDIAGDVSPKKLKIDGVTYHFGVVAKIGGKVMSGEYEIQNFDSVTVSEIETLGDLMLALPFDSNKVSFYKGGKLLNFDYFLTDGDDIVTSDKVVSGKAKADTLAKAIADMEKAERLLAKEEKEEKTAEKAKTDKPEKKEEDNRFYVILNGKKEYIDKKQSGSYEFIELLALADIDLDNPPPSGNMIFTLNGSEASFTTPVRRGDTAVIKWSDE